jgi:hypothetical protein
VVYAKAFFDLQLDFVAAVAALSGRPLASVLMDYTNLYIRLGLGRDFDSAHPTWQEYVGGLPAANDRREWTYRFYLARADAVAGPTVVATSGCFAYSRLSDERIRLHFQNVETDGHSPLAADRVGRRQAELAALFESVPAPVRVIGASWLYNLEAYRRLFPPSYLATAHVLTGRFRHMPLWGQFLDRQGSVRAAPAGQLLDRLARQSSLDGLDHCFPLPVLSVEAPVQDFQGFYRHAAPRLGAPAPAARW